MIRKNVKNTKYLSKEVKVWSMGVLYNEKNT